MSDLLFRNSGTSGLYHFPRHRQATIAKAADRQHLRLLLAEILPPADKAKVLAQIGKALAFPDWYGANFDALFDCLTDTDWQVTKGHVIVINGLGELRNTHPEDFSTLLEVLRDAADHHRQAGAPFWILIDTPARGVPALPEA